MRCRHGVRLIQNQNPKYSCSRDFSLWGTLQALVIKPNVTGKVWEDISPSPRAEHNNNCKPSYKFFHAIYQCTHSKDMLPTTRCKSLLHPISVAQLRHKKRGRHSCSYDVHAWEKPYDGQHINTHHQREVSYIQMRMLGPRYLQQICMELNKM